MFTAAPPALSYINHDKLVGEVHCGVREDRRRHHGETELPVYGIGMGPARITRAVLRNEQVSLPASTLLRGCIRRGRHLHRRARRDRATGMQRMVELELDTTEHEQFARSASALRAVSEKFEILR